MLSLPRSAAVLAVLALALAGCGGGDDDKPTDETTSSSASDDTVDVEAASGDTIETDDFSYTLPDGWKDASESSAAANMPASAVSLAGDATDTSDGFTDNVNVLRLDPAPVTDPDDLEDAALKELQGVGGSDLKVADRVDVDGSTAIHLSGSMQTQGINDVIEQFHIIHEGASYVVTFSFSPDVAQDDRDEVSQSVLASWSWAA